MRYVLLALTIFLSSGAFAQIFSYVYIQGDKKTPFYVKREGVMMPRYGKDYCILSELQEGPMHIEVLFQQHAFPPQKFTIMVPEHGFRGLMLDRQGDHFVLYDFQKKRYLEANEQ